MGGGATRVRDPHHPHCALVLDLALNRDLEAPPSKLKIRLTQSA